MSEDLTLAHGIWHHNLHSFFGKFSQLGLNTAFPLGLNTSFDGLGNMNVAKLEDPLEILLEQRDSHSILFSGVTRLNNCGEVGDICAFV